MNTIFKVKTNRMNFFAIISKIFKMYIYKYKSQQKKIMNTKDSSLETLS